MPIENPDQASPQPAEHNAPPGPQTIPARTSFPKFGMVVHSTQGEDP